MKYSAKKNRKKERESRRGQGKFALYQVFRRVSHETKEKERMMIQVPWEEKYGSNKNRNY